MVSAGSCDSTTEFVQPLFEVEHVVSSDTAAVEDGISAGTNQASSDEQDDPEQDLALDELDDTDDGKYHGDDPEKGSSHCNSPFVAAVCTQRSTAPNDNGQELLAAFRSSRRE